MIEGFQEGDLADIQILYNDIDGHSAVVYFPPKEDYECGSMCVADLNDKGAYVKSDRNWINHTLRKTKSRYDWVKDLDENDNDIWTLLSPYHDDGTPLEFRLSKKLEDNAIIYYSTSDEELGGNMGIAENDLEAAKRQIEQCYENCLTTIAGDC